VRPSDIGPPSTGFLIWHVSLRWRAMLDRALVPLGITATQYAVLAPLYALTRQGARPSQREIADFSGLGDMHVSKLARALERAGLLRRVKSSTDPRVIELSLTERGADVVRAGVSVVRRLEEERLVPLGGRDSARSVALRELLKALLRHADAPDAGRRSPAATALLGRRRGSTGTGRRRPAHASRRSPR
jgi:MarR family transcriptional regulator, organic hydroperoxide resistance regulator